jgi:hypothetical protein
MRTRLVAIFSLLFTLLPVDYLHGNESLLYFPLKPGMTWTYQVVSDRGETRKIIVTDLPPREIGDTKLALKKWNFGGASKYYLIGTDDSGVYRYGEQESENSEPIVTKPKVYYLKNPISNGTTWDINTKLGEDNLTVNLTIESISDSVSVPAGTFKDCLKIKHVGGNQQNGASISLEAYEWYAPEVGLVKSIVSLKKLEKGQTKSAEHQTYQLESFKP